MAAKIKNSGPSNEHIFKKTEITALAVRWKELVEGGAHSEAMLILEQIVVMSTVMFERLAQHEEYHHTVDLPVLVSAAQEKVVRWLEKWDPKKGNIFSWFSKSLTGDTQVVLEDGSYRRIDDIVDNREPVRVLSYNEVTGAIEPKRVTDWIKHESRGRWEWRKVSAKHPSGFRRIFYVTFDHEVYTPDGWKKVDDADQMFLRCERLTPFGKQAIIGMYLGDGHLSKQHSGLQVGHSVKQKAYTEWIASLFGKNVYSSTVTVNGKAHGVSSVCIPLLSLWPKSRQMFASDKIVSGRLLDSIDDVALAYWYMDDGSAAFSKANGNTYRVLLHTCNFSETECGELVRKLLTEFSVGSKVVKRKSGYCDIHIDKGSFSRFFEVVSPHVIPSMAYKLHPFYHGRHVAQKAVITDLVQCAIDVRPLKGKTNLKTAGSRNGKAFIPDFSSRYDLTVDGNFNFFAEGLLVHNCAKNAFRSELYKVNQYRKRYYAPGDDLEKYYEMRAPGTDRAAVAESFYSQLKDIHCRWGCPQEIGAVKFLVECIIDVDNSKHDRQAAIRGAAYAWGVSIDLSKVFYAWALVALRDINFKRIHIPFTQHDLIRHSESYTPFVNLYDNLTHDQIVWLIATHGGQRIKIPTMASIVKLKQNYKIFVEIEASDKDPGSVAKVAKENNRTPRSAQEAFNEMALTLNPQRSGEFPVYEDDEHDG